MAEAWANRVRQTATCADDTADYQLVAGTTPDTFSTVAAGIGNGNTFWYAAVGTAGWEVNYATVTTGTPDTISRDVRGSSNGGAAIDWAGAAVTIASDIPAEYLIAINAAIAANTAAVAALGTISTQDADAVAITGGTLTGVTADDSSNDIHAQVVDHTVVNRTGGTLAKSTPIKLGTWDIPAGHPEAIVSDPSDPATMPADGVIEDELADDAIGDIVRIGQVKGTAGEPLNTSAFAQGADLYVGAGVLTTTAPSAPDLVQKIGFCARSHVTMGVIGVGIPGETHTEAGEALVQAASVPAQRTLLGMGSGVVTCGPGGQYASLDLALEAVNAAVTAPVEVGLVFAGGTVTATQYDATLTFAGMPTTFNNGFSTNELTRRFWVEVNNDGKPRLIKSIKSGTELILSSGYDGTTSAGLSYKFWELPSYTVQLLPGDIEFPVAVDMSTSWCQLSLVGAGRDATRIWAPTSLAPTITFYPPSIGSLLLQNLSWASSTITIPIAQLATSTWNAAPGSGFALTIDNCGFYKLLGTGAVDIINLTSAEMDISNCIVDSTGDTLVMIADSMRIQNNSFRTATAQTENSFAFRSYRQQFNHPAVIRGNTVFSNAGAGQAQLWFKLPDSVHPTKTKPVYMQGNIVDGKIYASVQTDATGKLVINLYDCRMAELVSDGGAACNAVGCTTLTGTAFTQTATGSPVGTINAVTD